MEKVPKGHLHERLLQGSRQEEIIIHPVHQDQSTGAFKIDVNKERYADVHMFQCDRFQCNANAECDLCLSGYRSKAPHLP